MQRLLSLAQDEGATLYMVLLAGLKAVLHRYTGQTDLVVGSPVANRGSYEFDVHLDFSGNMLALRTDLAGDPSFRAALARVRATALTAYEHQDLPFETVVTALAPA